MRYDAPELLAAWSKRREWPRIHAGVFGMACTSLPAGAAVIDLCCSTGLLGERLHRIGFSVLGLDRDARALASGAAAGVSMPTVCVAISGPDGIATALEHIAAHAAVAVIARRCMPELFGEDHELGRAFVSGLWAAGVQHVLLEGRRATIAPANSLPSVDHEIALCAAHYEVEERDGAVALLRARRLS